MILLKNKIYKIPIIIIIFISFTPLSLISKSVEAAIVGSQMISTNGRSYLNREINEKKIRKMLENKIVVEKFKSYGLSDEELATKLKSMSDEHIHQLAALSDRIPAGGNGAAAAAVIVLVVFVIAIILLIVLRRI